MTSLKTDHHYQEVINANIEVHSRTADEYHTEPHFRPENIAKVNEKLGNLARQTQAQKMLDLGCGTGFMINIAKQYVPHIDGVDVTQAMLDRVDTSGEANIRLFNHDTGSFTVEKNAYDLVTAYSFLHHLYDIVPTLKTAYDALKPGGKFYVDLDPNYYFWAGIDQLDRDGAYDAIVKREIEMVSHIDEQVGKRFNIDFELINLAEYGKNVKGGFKAEELDPLLRSVGFQSVELQYYWYIGQGYLINHEQYSPDKRQEYAEVTEDVLQKLLPLSKGLYKYLGFVATK
ncbi:class I SAM-dependent methyltransferase [Vampirovibrio sp.]|uniref:class I SAM-dependent DNA methyltransferase n=1 Tax=Vampirovibrio sp. TaxID=2717857 RepID=UPI0035943920